MVHAGVMRRSEEELSDVISNGTSCGTDAMTEVVLAVHRSSRVKSLGPRIALPTLPTLEKLLASPKPPSIVTRRDIATWFILPTKDRPKLNRALKPSWVAWGDFSAGKHVCTWAMAQGFDSTMTATVLRTGNGHRCGQSLLSYYWLRTAILMPLQSSPTNLQHRYGYCRVHCCFQGRFESRMTLPDACGARQCWVNFGDLSRVHVLGNGSPRIWYAIRAGTNVPVLQTREDDLRQASIPGVGCIYRHGTLPPVHDLLLPIATPCPSAPALHRLYGPINGYPDSGSGACRPGPLTACAVAWCHFVIRCLTSAPGLGRYRRTRYRQTGSVKPQHLRLAYSSM
nr:hypothetical protein CFP56_28713 [Quercus suber]